MTVREMRDWLNDRKFWSDENQEMMFKFGNAKFEVLGSTVPEKGPAVIEMKKTADDEAMSTKFMFSLKFEANPVIEAKSQDEAERKAWAIMEQIKVMRHDDTGGLECLSEVESSDLYFAAMEPEFLEEVEE